MDGGKYCYLLSISCHCKWFASSSFILGSSRITYHSVLPRLASKQLHKNTISQPWYDLPFKHSNIQTDERTNVSTFEIPDTANTKYRKAAACYHAIIGFFCSISGFRRVSSVLWQCYYSYYWMNGILLNEWMDGRTDGWMDRNWKFDGPWRDVAKRLGGVGKLVGTWEG